LFINISYEAGFYRDHSSCLTILSDQSCVNCNGNGLIKSRMSDINKPGQCWVILTSQGSALSALGCRELTDMPVHWHTHIQDPSITHSPLSVSHFVITQHLIYTLNEKIRQMQISWPEQNRLLEQPFFHNLNPLPRTNPFKSEENEIYQPWNVDRCLTH
jgi:hypothetical protein